MILVFYSIDPILIGSSGVDLDRIKQRLRPDWIKQLVWVKNLRGVVRCETMQVKARKEKYALSNEI